MWGKHRHEIGPPNIVDSFSPSFPPQLARNHGIEEIANGLTDSCITGTHIRSMIQFTTTVLPMKPSRTLIWLILRRLDVFSPAEDLSRILIPKEQCLAVAGIDLHGSVPAGPQSVRIR
jgi:hypothetical protein